MQPGWTPPEFYHRLNSPTRRSAEVSTMGKQVQVTGAQRDAARMIVQRSTAQGRSVSPSVRKIAEASTRSVGVPTTATTGTDRPHHSASDIFKMIKASLRRRPAR